VGMCIYKTSTVLTGSSSTYPSGQYTRGKISSPKQQINKLNHIHFSPQVHDHFYHIKL
jgi:hypothetical protein